jgi:hypothetical protein
VEHRHDTAPDHGRVQRRHDLRHWKFARQRNPQQLRISGYFTLCGTALTAGGDDPSPDILWDTGGNCPPQSQAYCVSLTPVTAADDKILVAYTIALGSNVGPHRVWVMTYAGYSNMTQTFNIGDPTPVITSVSSYAWAANTSFTLEIGGNGFGYSPTVTIKCGNGTTPCSGITPIEYTCAGTSCDAHIQFTVLVNPDAPRQNATVFIDSKGYDGTGFLPAQPGQSGQARQDGIGIVPVALARPQIILGANTGGIVANTGAADPLCAPGQDVVDRVCTVYAGQQIAFTGVVPPNASGLASAAWSPPTITGLAVSGYNIEAKSASAHAPLALFSPACDVASNRCAFNPFYWVDFNAGDRTFGFTYTLRNNESAAAMVTFHVVGPTATGVGNSYMTAELGQPSGNRARLITVWPPEPDANYARLEMGHGEAGSAGITFTVSAQPPAGHNGSFQFVQLITTDNYALLGDPAQNSGVSVTKGDRGTGLDNWYPYPVRFNTATGGPLNPLQSVDYPSQFFELFDRTPEHNPMNANIVESALNFAARMYVMWDPALPGAGQTNCTAATDVPVNNTTANPQPSTCAGSIPIPLGYTTWGFGGCAIDTKNPQATATANATGTLNGTTWAVLTCSQPTAPAYQATTTFPTWTTVVKNK